MAFTPTYSNSFSVFCDYMKETANLTNPDSSDSIKYRVWDAAIGEAYETMHSWLGQPILQTSVTYIWEEDFQISRRGEHVLPYHNVPLVSPTLSYRITPFNSTPFVALTVNTDFVVEERREGWAVFRRIIGTDFKLTASVGFTDAAMPQSLLRGMCEIAAMSVARSVHGAGILGKVTVGQSGAAGNISTTYNDIKDEWVTRYAKYKVRAI